MCVIYATINRSLDIMDELGNKFIFMEADQAIYHKILDAIFRMEKESQSNHVPSLLKAVSQSNHVPSLLPKSQQRRSS